MLKNIFFDGFNLNNFIEIANKNEKENFLETEKNIMFSADNISRIKNIDKNIYIVASVETWCPYARTFVATVKKMAELNSKINLSLVTMGRGFMDIAEFLEINEDDFVVPTALILDENFKFKKSFVGFPQKYSETGLGRSANDYFKGLKADEILNDII